MTTTTRPESVLAPADTEAPAPEQPNAEKKRHWVSCSTLCRCETITIGKPSRRIHALASSTTGWLDVSASARQRSSATAFPRACLRM